MMMWRRELRDAEPLNRRCTAPDYLGVGGQKSQWCQPPLQHATPLGLRSVAPGERPTISPMPTGTVTATASIICESLPLLTVRQQCQTHCHYSDSQRRCRLPVPGTIASPPFTILSSITLLPTASWFSASSSPFEPVLVHFKRFSTRRLDHNTIPDLTLRIRRFFFSSTSLTPHRSGGFENHARRLYRELLSSPRP